MTLEEAAKQFSIPLDDLKRMEREGLLSDPLSLDEISNLAFLRYFWDDAFWLRRQFSRRNKKARKAFLQTVEFSKTEAYVFNRYFNAEKRLFVRDVANELHVYYGVPVTGKLIQTIYRMRRKATDARHYDRKKRTGERDYWEGDDFENCRVSKKRRYE